MVPVLGTILDTVYLRSAAIAVAPELCIFVRSDLGGRVGLVLWFFAVWVTSYVQTGVLYIFDGVACAASHDYVTHLLSPFQTSPTAAGRADGGEGQGCSGRAARKGRRRTVEGQRRGALPFRSPAILTWYVHTACSHAACSHRERHLGCLDHRCVGIGFEVSSGRQSSQLTRCQYTRGQ